MYHMFRHTIFFILFACLLHDQSIGQGYLEQGKDLRLATGPTSKKHTFELLDPSPPRINHESRYKYHEGERCLKIIILDLPDDESPIDLFVLSDGSWLKRMGWFRYTFEVLIKHIEESKSQIKIGLLLGCGGEGEDKTLVELIDPAAANTEEASESAWETLIAVQNQRKTQSLLKLLVKIDERLRKKDLKVRSLTILVGTEWFFDADITFAGMKPEEMPGPLIKRLRENGATRINLIQLYEKGAPPRGKAPKFQKDFILVAIKDDAVREHDLALTKIPLTGNDNQRKQAEKSRDILKNKLHEIILKIGENP
jgi:hypothetical protein